MNLWRPATGGRRDRLPPRQQHMSSDLHGQHSSSVVRLHRLRSDGLHQRGNMPPPTRPHRWTPRVLWQINLQDAYSTTSTASSTTATTATPTTASITSSTTTTTASIWHHHCDDRYMARKDQPMWWPHRQRRPLTYARRPQWHPLTSTRCKMLTITVFCLHTMA